MVIGLTYDMVKKEVFGHFGEVPNFLLVDLDNGTRKVIGNGGFSHRELIPYLAKQGISVLICGGIGAPAVSFFKDAGIEVIPGVSGNVDEVIEMYKKGELKGNDSLIHQCDCHHDR